MNRSALPALLLAAGLAGLAGCSASADPGQDSGGTPGQTPGGTPASDNSGYPLTVTNCGTAVTLTAPPERILTIKSTALETVLALGLGSRVIGSAFTDGPVPAALADGAAVPPSISDAAPSREAVLELEPDFIYAGWESNLSAETAGDRPFLASLGIGSYVSPAACRAEGARPGKLDFEDVFADITEAGAVFGAPEAAAALVAGQRELLAGVEPSGQGRTAFWYSSGRDTPYSGAGLGAPQLILDRLGLKNIAADVPEAWAPLSWETVVAANPDVIVLIDSDWNSAAAKKELLASHPATAAMDAVINERYLVLPFAAGEAGVRNAEAVADLAGQLADLP